MIQETNETLEIIDRIAPVILMAAIDPKTAASSALRRMVGMMVVDGNMVHMATFATAFGFALDLARRCSATLVTMDRVRKAALAETPVSFAAQQTVLAMVRLTLAAEARIISEMTFRSRDEVDDIATVVNEAFSQTVEIAADAHDAHTYRALIAMHGSITQHLAAKGRVLPRVIAYQYQTVMPSLRMAFMVYADAARSLDLRNENRVVHPAFMPRTGKMLAV